MDFERHGRQVQQHALASMMTRRERRERDIKTDVHHDVEELSASASLQQPRIEKHIHRYPSVNNTLSITANPPS